VLRFFILIVGGVFIGQDALVQDAGNQNTTTLRPSLLSKLGFSRIDLDRIRRVGGGLWPFSETPVGP